MMSAFENWNPFPEKDARVQDWPLFGSPIPVLTILTCYVLIVKVIAPAIMTDRKSYDLRGFILIYNAAMVVGNLSTACLVYSYAYYSGHYRLWFAAPDPSMHPNTLTLISLTWYYIFLRFAECIETVIFVLRKRYRQVSGLHVFHHVSVTFSVYLYATYGCVALCSFEAGFNAVIHVFMYGYYFLSAYGPSTKKHLWWKKYITVLQLIQFIFMIARNVSLYFWLNNRYSSLPAFMLFQCFVFFVQFMHFYVTSYRQNDHKLQSYSEGSEKVTEGSEKVEKTL